MPSDDVGAAEIRALEMQIYELNQKLAKLQKRSGGDGPVPDYTFATLEKEVTLSQLFAGRDQLLVIHNMGQGCRYCTLWADGFNGLLPHLEAAMSVVLVSKDPPELQRRFASSRGWRFRLASHSGGDYIGEQSVQDGETNMPGVVLYERTDDGIRRKNSAVFGPGDRYCAFWSLIGLAGMDPGSFTPQYAYWTRPETLDDGGENVLG